MGSLNGDMLVNRNGRATTQVTIYNYPEHLNPFYEDEQHKRLRFWKVMSKGKDSKDSNRRNSFSLGNFKEMWAFKSFRLKKKSSTLGIYKTSESPPPLRRDQCPVDDQSSGAWNTFDHRLRQSHNITSSSLTLQNGPFQRHSNYRSSLQHLPVSTNSSQQDISENDSLGFHRNDNIRSTIQVAGSSLRGYRRGHRPAPPRPAMSCSPPVRRYVLSGSTTLEPNQSDNYLFAHRILPKQSPLPNGSLNVNANPFDSDDNENEEQLDSNSRSQSFSTNSTPQKQTTPRKKRRAPPPPPSTKSIMTDFSENISDTNNNHSQIGLYPKTDELCIREETDVIALTTAITNFVENKRKSDEKDALETKLDHHQDQTNTKESSKSKIQNLNLRAEVDDKRKPTNIESQVVEVEEPKKLEKTDIIVVSNPEEKKSNLEQKPKEESKNLYPSIKQEATKIEDKLQHNINQPEIKQINQASIETQNKLEHKRTNLSPILRRKVENSNNDLNQDNGNVESNQKLPQQQLKIKENQIDLSKTISKDADKITHSFENSENNNMDNYNVEEVQLRRAMKPPVATKRSQRENFKGLTAELSVESSSQLSSKEKPSKSINKSSETSRFLVEESRKSLGSAIVKHQPIPNPRTRRLSIPNDIIGGSQPPNMEAPQSPKLNNTSFSIQKINNHLNINEDTFVKSKDVEEEKEEEEDQQGLPKYSEVVVDIHQPIERNSNSNKNLNIIQIPKIPARMRNIKLENIEDQESFSKRNLIQKRAEYAQRNDSEPQTTTGSSSIEWKHSTLAPLETNIPRERRRSVKDIIESINRSQRILNEAANKQFPPIRSDLTNTNVQENPIILDKNIKQPSNDILTGIEDKLTNPDRSQLEMKRMVEEIEMFEHEVLPELANVSTPKTPISDRIRGSSSPIMVNGNGQLAKEFAPENTEIIFEKCRVTKDVYNGRESSPTSANLDWNPLPKPKRTKTID